MKEQDASKRILFRYLVYFLLLLLVPLLCIAVIYFRVTFIVTYNAYNQDLAAMKASAGQLEKHLNDLESLSYNIAQNSQMSRFFSLSPLEEDRTIVSPVYEAQKDLHFFTVANAMISGIQLYSESADVLIDSQTGVMSFERYYGNVFEMEGYTMEEWRETFLEGSFLSETFPARTVRYGGIAKRRILFAQSVPFSSAQHARGNMYIYMDEADLVSLFRSIPYADGGFLSIADASGNTIVQDDPRGLARWIDRASMPGTEGYAIQTIDGVDQLVIRFQDNRFGWEYIAAIPHGQVLASTNSIRAFLVAMLLLSLAGGATLAVYYAYKTSRPVVSVYKQLLSGGPQSPNDLGDEIAALVQRNADLKARVEQQIPAQQTSLVYSLLTGGFHEEAELRRSFEKLNIPLQAERYVVLVTVLTDLDTELSIREIGVYKEVVKELLRAGFDGIIGVCDIDFERIVLLAGAAGEPESALRRRYDSAAMDIADHALRDVGISLSFTGRSVDHLTDIPAAFSAAQSAEFLAAAHDKERIQWYRETGAPSYPDALESSLMLAVKEGKAADVGELLDALQRQNERLFDSMVEGKGEGYALIQRMHSTLLRLATGLPSGNDGFLRQCSAIAFALSRQEQSPATLFAQIRECLCSAAEQYAETSLSSNALRARILEYVDAHYGDPQISLASVAGNFGITEVYLSRVFKQITGENFSRHIEKLRMEQANRLIEAGEHRISDIAEMVGYNSPQVFRRAYKRYFGRLPSEFLRER